MTPFQTSRSEQEVFDDLGVLCGSPSFIHVLAYLSCRDNLVTYDGDMTSEVMAASYARGRTVRTEFSTLMGLMLKHPIEFCLPAPSDMPVMINKTEILLKELRACFNQPMIEAFKGRLAAQQAGLSVDEASLFSRGDVLREPIFYGGDSAYSFQYRDLALDRYAKDDDWLHANKGFRVADGHAIAGALTRLHNRKVQTINGMRRLDPSQWTTLPGFTSSLEEIASEAGITPKSASAVLAALTAPEPPTNAGFKTLGDFNIANACPILRSPSGDYVSFDTYRVVEALYDSPFYWMAADKAYKDTAFTHRGAFTEDFVARRLAAVFGAANVHRNVNIVRNGSRVSEIDVLVVFADRAVVIQCKSKKLTLEARKGNDLQLRDDFKKSVQDAYDQAYLCAKSLGDPDVKFVGQDGAEVSLSALREIYPVCVVSDHYPALTVQAREFLMFQTDDKIQPPLITDVFLIDVLAEMLTSPLRLLSYINRRVNYARRIHSVSELTILGYHLQQNLWIDKNVGMVALDESLATELDTAMQVRRESLIGARTPDGVLTCMDGTLVGRILKAIENCAEPAWWIWVSCF
ncbi:prepilin peptidase [Iodidimonas gelatinilytica]|uniref:Prepilin peptidase n=1 Tax=Iodidimonas gelatinilytica TaxID=1236966 RepID=A0A5A7N5C0_9PROT|nr:nuclease-related domain-containing protein [Iodidimonas gelatinilytica]GER02259.1 prepilin peptidase [Iodidimonas gelatinilytica]